VTRETLQGILAARSSALDGASLLATRLATPGAAPAAGAAPSARSTEATPQGPYVFAVGDTVPAAGEPATGEPIQLPDLAGMTLRDAIRRAHAFGLRVRLRGSGRVERSEPAAGAQLTRGDTLVLVGAEP
jgi:hypothetical protein